MWLMSLVSGYDTDRVFAGGGCGALAEGHTCWIARVERWARNGVLISGWGNARCWMMSFFGSREDWS